MGILIYIYKTHFPSEDSAFPSCPFKSITQLECPGCGSQRATHYLLNFELGQAFRSNALFLFFVPYIIFGLVYTNFLNARQIYWVRLHLYGKTASLLILTVVMVYWILRNVV